MGMLISDYRRADSGPAGVGMASAADVWTYRAVAPIEIVRSGIIAVTSSGFMQTATSVFTCRVDYMTKASAKDAGYTRTSGAVGTLTTNTAGDLAFNGNGIYTNVSSPITLNAGEAVIFAVTSSGAAASAGALGQAFIEFRDLPFTELNRPTSAPGDGTVATGGSIENMTKV